MTQFKDKANLIWEVALETFPENRQVAGNARKDTEKELGRSVISKENYLSDQLPENEQDKLEDQ